MSDAAIFAAGNIVALVVKHLLDQRARAEVKARVEIATESARLAYKEANDVNRKIADMGKRIE